MSYDDNEVCKDLCDYCGEWYDSRQEGDEHFCSDECKKNSEWDDKVSTQWGAM